MRYMKLRKNDAMDKLHAENKEITNLAQLADNVINIQRETIKATNALLNELVLAVLDDDTEKAKMIAQMYIEQMEAGDE